MITYQRLKKHRATFRQMTGMEVDEFDKLLPSFGSAWNNFVYKTFIEGRKRERKYGGGNEPNLKRIEDKLTFILIYYKVYPLQVVQGLLFDLAESNANRWIHRLSGVLKETLEYEKELPPRTPKTFDEIIQEYPEIKEMVIDGTERRIKRPKDPGKQKENYSGKKKAHTVKNVVVTDGKRKIKYLSRTVEGKKHDKRLAEEEGLRFPIGTDILADLGFEGYVPLGGKIHHPKKKPKGKPLTPLDREQNSVLGGLRVVVEHSLSGVKISRIVKDTYRNYREKFEDEIMEVACGLHNYRVEHRIGS